jgi:hypothetical protein
VAYKLKEGSRNTQGLVTRTNEVYSRQFKEFQELDKTVLVFLLPQSSGKQTQ